MAEPGPLVLLDANALMSAVRLKFDLAAEIAESAPGWKPAVPGSVLRELERLGDTRGAREARALAKRFPAVANEGRGDDAIVEAALAAPRRAVMTNDQALRRRLRGSGVTVLFIRGKQKVEIDGGLPK